MPPTRKKKTRKKAGGVPTQTLVRALDMITEGEAAPLPERLRETALEVKRSERAWSQGRGVQGLGIGPMITGGEVRPELSLKVYVERKLPLSKLRDPVPATLDLCDRKIPTDVEEIGRVAAEPNTGRVRPAIPGFGVGHLNVTVGTLGCLVHAGGDKTKLFILSNSHVLADEGVGRKGDPIVQPGVYDGGADPGDRIGKLADWVPFTFSASGYSNLVDAAIASVAKSNVTSVIKVIGVPAGTSTVVRRGMRVQKTGRTTDYTIGEIRDVNYRFALNYKKPGGGTGRVGFRDQVLCTRYTSGGDSGSAVLNMSGKVVGLHFAGSPSTSIFSRIGHVLSLLNVDVVTTRF